MAFELLANALASGPIPIRGLGLSIAPGEVATLESEAELERAHLSSGEIEAYSSDDAYGVGEHSIVVRALPGSIVIAPAEVAEFLDRARLESATVTAFEDSIIERDVTTTMVVEGGKTVVHRDTDIADGIEIEIEDDGELLIL